MATSYESIYERALQKIEDPELAQLQDEDLQAMFSGYLSSAISKFRKCKSDLSNRDDDLQEFGVDLLDVEQEILAILVAREWLVPQLNSTLLTKQVFAEKEQKYYSQSAHLLSLETRDRNLKTEAQKLQRDYTFNSGSYWED